MANYLLLLAVFLFSSIACAEDNAQAALSLIKSGQTSYVIALASDAIPAEKTAAVQLQKYLREVTSALLEIRSENDVQANAPQILVGAGTRVKSLLPQQKWDELGHDGIVIKTVGQNLILAGGRPRGTLYAVFQLLEDTVGCRWWTHNESTIPQKNTLNVPLQNIAYVPPFNYREHYTTEMRDPVFATIMRQNGISQRQTEEWGGHYNILGGSHTFSELLPPATYFKQHPEWYSDPANGNLPGTSASKMPAAQYTQLCLSNPQMLEELTKQALVWIKKNPDAGYISISQNDNSNYCRDAESMKLAEEEGSQAGPLLNFVNKVADRINQEYPNFKVLTLAYTYTKTPPKTIHPAKNVIIQIAPSGADFGRPLNSDWNAKTRDSFQEWSKITHNLFVWNYVTNFNGNMLPHPNWEGLASDLRFFAATNVKDVFEQGDNYTGGVGDFVQLRAWLIGKLMWNPNLDQEQLTNEFLHGYYGPAAPHLKQYLDLLQQSFLSQGHKLLFFNYDFSFITLDVANESIRLFDKAEAAVEDNKAVLHRVQRERLSMELAILYRHNILKRVAVRTGKPFLGPKDPATAMKNLIASAKTFGVKDWAEGTSFDSKIPHLLEMFSVPVELPDFAKKYPLQDVIDLQPAYYRLEQKGTITRIEDDPAASAKTAVSILGTTKEWAVQVPLDQFLDSSDDKWRIYVIARVDIKDGVPQTGAAFSSGVYDDTNEKFSSSKTISLAQLEGDDYHPADIGVHPLNSGMYIWIAPTRNPAVTKVYIDRILLIRENKR